MRNKKIKNIIMISTFIFSSILILYAADSIRKEGVKKISNNKYTFGDIGDNLGHRLYDKDGNLISRDNNSVKNAYDNESLQVTYNGEDVCEAQSQYQTAKGFIGPLTPVAANIADWNKPLLTWDNGVTISLNRQPGYRGKGKYSFHYDNISNPNLTKQDGTPWESTDFTWGDSLIADPPTSYNTPDGFTIYEDGKEITSKTYDIGTGNGTDGEIVTDVLDEQGNPTGLLKVKGKYWSRKDGTKWQFGSDTIPNTGVIGEGEIISDKPAIYGPEAEDGFCLYFNGKEITSYIENIENEECEITGEDEKIVYTKRKNWCDKDGNSFNPHDMNFSIKDAYGNDILREEYITIENEKHDPLLPVIANLSDWQNLYVPAGDVYLDPSNGGIKNYISGSETIDNIQIVDNGGFSADKLIETTPSFESTFAYYYYTYSGGGGGGGDDGPIIIEEPGEEIEVTVLHPKVAQTFTLDASCKLSHITLKFSGMADVSLNHYITVTIRELDDPELPSSGRYITSKSIVPQNGENDIYFEDKPFLESGKTYVILTTQQTHDDTQKIWVDSVDYPDEFCKYYDSRDNKWYLNSKDLFFRVWGYLGENRILNRSRSFAEIFSVNNDGNLNKIQLNIKHYSGSEYLRVTLGELDASTDYNILGSEYKYLSSSIASVKNNGILDVYFENLPFVESSKKYCLIFSLLDNIEDTEIRFAYDETSISGPTSVSVNPTDGTCWVADTGNNKVKKISSDGGEILVNRVVNPNPSSVSVNPTDGTCWVACYGTQSFGGDGRILRISADGSGVLYEGTLNNPISVCINPVDGVCWVTHNGWVGVKKISPNGVISYAVVAACMNPPSVSVNPNNGYAWVAQTENKVRLITTIGTVPNNIWYDLVGFNNPTSVSVNPTDGTCWVADTGNNKIKKVSADATYVIEELVGFNNPTSVSVNPTDGTCWVADTGNNKVKKISADGTQVLVEVGRYNGYLRRANNTWEGVHGAIWLKAFFTEKSEIPKGPLRVTYNTKPIKEVIANDFDSDANGVVDKSEILGLMDNGINKVFIDIENNLIFINPNSYLFKLNENITSIYNIKAIKPPDPESSDLYSVSVDPNDGSCWVASADPISLYKINSDCNEMLSYSTGGSGGTADPESVSVDPNNGTCWFGAYRYLKRINADGSQLITVIDSSVINRDFGRGSVSVDPATGYCWAMDRGNGELFKVSNDASQIQNLTGFPLYAPIVADPIDGSCLVYYSSEHLLKRVSSDLSLIDTIVEFSGGGFTVNPNDGTIWLIEGGKAKHIDRNGALINEIDGIQGGGIAVSPIDNSIWVAGFGTVKHLTPDGQLLFESDDFNSITSISINSHDGSCWILKNKYLASKINKIEPDAYASINKKGIMTFDYNYKRYPGGVMAKNLADDDPDENWKNGPSDADQDKIFIDPIAGRFRFHDDNTPEGRLTVSYNFNANAQDLRSHVYGELAIDPGNGRILFHPEDVPLYPTDETMNGFFYYKEGNEKPLPPIVLNAVQDTSDSPFVLKGSKQENTSVWLEIGGNKTEIIEENPDTDWTYSLYLNNGNNNLIFTSKKIEMESDANNYSINFGVKNPTIDNESPVSMPIISLAGKKAGNSSIELLKHIDNQTPGDGGDSTEYNYTYSFFNDSDFKGEIVKDNGDSIENSQQGINDAIANGDLVVYADGDNLFNESDPLIFTAVVVDLSDETGSPIWTDPDTPEPGKIAIDLNTGRFKFNAQDVPIDPLTVKFNYFEKIISHDESLTWTYDWSAKYGDLASGDNLFSIRSADRMNNVSENVNKTIVYDTGLIGVNQIDYLYKDNDSEGKENDIEITFSAGGIFDFKLTWTEAEMNTVPADIDQSLYSGNSYTYNNVKDSPYLTFHIKRSSGSEWTHKHITSRQLTSLVPFIDEFSSDDSLIRQGTYTKVPSGSTGWTVNGSGVLENTILGQVDKLIIPQKFPTWQDYQFTVYVKKKTGSSADLDFSLLYKVTDLDDYYEFRLDEDAATPKVKHFSVVGDSPTEILNTENNSIDLSIFNNGNYIPVKVEVRHHKSSGNTYVKAFIDDQQVNYFVHNMPIFGGVGIKADNTEIAVDKLEIRPLK